MAAQPGEGSRVRIDQPHATVSTPVAMLGEADLSAQAFALAEVGAQMAQAGALAGQTDGDVQAAAMLVGQVRKQAEQLSRHLKDQQTRLDQRESTLNARQASLDGQMRSNRMWLDSRQRDLADREEQLAARHDKLEAWEKRIESTLAKDDDRKRELEHQFAAKQAELDELESERHKQWQVVGENLHKREQDLLSREAKIESQSHGISATEMAWRKACQAADEQLAKERRDLAEREAALYKRQEALDAFYDELVAREVSLERTLTEQNAELIARQKALTDNEKLYAERLVRADQADAYAVRCNGMAARQRHVEAAEKLLAEMQSSLEGERREFAADRAAWQDEAASERRKLAEEQHAGLAEIDRRKAQLEARADEIANREAAVAELHRQVKLAQEESLELRLATEELWSRLAGSMAPAAVTQNLAQIRARLAEQLRGDKSEVLEQQHALDQLRKRLELRQHQLEATRIDLEKTLSQREDEIERQAAHLVAREQQLDEHEHAWNQKSSEWRVARQEYEREIRKLLRQLRRGDGAVPVRRAA